MLDFNHILSNPNIDVQTFIGQAQATAGAATGEWKSWRKPRGVKFVYIIAVGGGSSGGVGFAGTTTSGGGAGGGSGAMSTLMIPAMFLPDVLYIQAGLGGSQPATLVSAAVGVAGTITYVALEPWNTLAAGLTVAFASAGAVTGTGATATAGGVVGTAAAIATIANMPLAGRGAYQFFAGQAGSAGGASTAAGTALALPTTGLMVTGGTGAGGTNGTGQAGGQFNLVGFGDNFPAIPGGIAAVTSTPAGAGSSGTMLKPFQYYGGTGGGGATSTAGGTPGDGGNGAPGCGGGGGAGSLTQNATLARPGHGGPGFVYIYSW